MDINLLKSSRWLRCVLWFVLSVIVVWCAGWLAVPPLVRNQIEKQASEALGRAVTVGRVDFKPWTLELTLDDIAVARAPGIKDASPQLEIKQLYIDAELQSLWRMAPVMDAFEVKSPHLNVTHLGGGRYDIDDVLSRLTAPSASSNSGPVLFALYNLALSTGSIDFFDQSVNQTHQLRDLQVSLPFLSNLASQRTVLVEPHLAFLLNGSQFDTRAQGTPFVQTSAGEARFKLAAFNLAPYLAYLPASLPVQLGAAVLDADLKIAFEQSPEMRVGLGGTIQASAVKLAARPASGTSTRKSAMEGASLLEFDQLKITLDDVRPLERVVRLAAVELIQPRLTVHRNQAGQLNLVTVFSPSNAMKIVAGHAGDTGGRASNDAKERVWTVDVAKVLLHQGALDWTDEATTPSARLAVRDLALDASGFAWPLVSPVPWRGSANLMAQAKGEGLPGQSGRLTFSGAGTGQSGQAELSLADGALSWIAPYMAQFMVPEVNGSLTTELLVNWQTGVNRMSPVDVTVLARQLTLDQLAVTQEGRRLVDVKKVELTQAQLDLTRQTVTMGTVSVVQPQLDVRRAVDGRWMYETWLKPEQAPEATVPLAGSDRPAKRWGVAVNDLRLQGGSVKFADSFLAQPVAFTLSGLAVGLKNFSTHSDKPFSGQVSSLIRTGQAGAGRLDWRGTVGLAPLSVDGRINADQVPVQAFGGYFAEAVNLELVQAFAGIKGQMSYAETALGPVLGFGGDVAVDDLWATARVPGQLPMAEKLLSWRRLSLQGLELAVAPDTATRLSVKSTALNDFFARIVLNESGRLNLQDVMKKSSASGPPAAAQKPDAVISVGPVVLRGGNVYFSDHFIQPHYSTQLTGLDGQLSAFSSVAQPGQTGLADLELRGRAEGTAALEITGKLNPLTTPVALDINGRVRDLELPPFSMYSVRHAGYGIERGKLGVDVHYAVQPDGQLTANNKIVLNQLTFGDKVDGAPTSLPVKLAVALLADRNGVIDIDLPISGSLNDPQFKLGPIVFKLIVNLVTRAITAPFSLLGAALGGEADAVSVVTFEPGSAVLEAGMKPGLDKVAQVLLDRPSLKMTVVGWVSPEAERPAFQRQQFKTLVYSEKRHAGAGEGVVTESEYPALLKTVYRRANFKKPSNMLGMMKDLPVPEMEALLLDHFSVTDDALHELALQRGVAVRDYLASQKLPLDRLFLGAVKTAPSGAKWSPRAELNLSSP